MVQRYSLMQDMQRQLVGWNDKAHFEQRNGFSRSQQLLRRQLMENVLHQAEAGQLPHNFREEHFEGLSNEDISLGVRNLLRS